MIADSDLVDKNFAKMKKAQLKKLKSEKKKGNLMAMLKTVKKRKAEDLISEAVTELEQIDKEAENQQIPVESEQKEDGEFTLQKPQKGW